MREIYLYVDWVGLNNLCLYVVEVNLTYIHVVGLNNLYYLWVGRLNVQKAKV